MMEKYGNWKKELERKGLRLNVNKTKSMKLINEEHERQRGGRMRNNLDNYLQCLKWIHHCCSNVPNGAGLVSVCDTLICKLNCENDTILFASFLSNTFYLCNIYLI